MNLVHLLKIMSYHVIVTIPKVVFEVVCQICPISTLKEVLYYTLNYLFHLINLIILRLYSLVIL